MPDHDPSPPSDPPPPRPADAEIEARIDAGFEAGTDAETAAGPTAAPPPGGEPSAAPGPPRRRSLTGCLVPLVLLALLAWWGRPFLENAWRIVQLATAEAPTSLPVPVEGVAPGRLTDTWGAARSGGRSHQGIDIFAPRGTPVLATTRGVVTKRGENRLGGRVVTVMGPGRQFHYYAHMEDWSDVAAGDWVEAGTVLGHVGTSGNAAGTPPHLHYGIYTPTGAINPHPLLTTP